MTCLQAQISALNELKTGLAVGLATGNISPNQVPYFDVSAINIGFDSGEQVEIVEHNQDE